MERRRFLKAAGVGAASAIAGVRALEAAPAADFSLRYVVASSMYGTMKLEDILPEVRKSGAEEIDIWPKVHGDQREQIEAMGHERFAELLARHKVKVGVITQYHLGPYKLGPEMPILKKFGGWLLIAGGAGAKGLKGSELKSAVMAFVENMKPHVAAAEEHGVSIGIENHGGGLMASPDAIRWLLEFGRSKRLGLALAPYHLPQDTKLLSSLIEEAGDRLFMFYAWEHGRGSGKLPKEEEMMQMPGRGPLDFTPLVRALKKIGYRNYTEPFMHPTPRGVPIRETPGAVTAEINRARAYLDRCLQGV
jgi:sugar phosphate isomerase/epimerase